MDSLQELKLNRIARIQNLQKGFNSFELGVIQEDDCVEKAHEVGEIKVGKDGIKRVWTQLPNGKYDWRRVKRDKKGEPAKQEGKTDDKSSEKHEHEYKIEDAEKYVDKSSVSSAEKKVAKFILGGKSEKEIKQMMARAKVDSSVVDHVYKLGSKLASEASNEAKRIYKKENSSNSSSDNLKENELKKIGFSKQVEGKEVWFEKKHKNRLLRIVQEEVGNNDWWIAKVDSEYVLDDNNKPVTFETPLEAAEEAINFVDSQKGSEPDFTPKIPKEISSLTNRSDWKDFDNAYLTLGAEIFKEKFPTAADFQKWVNDNPYKGIKTQKEMELYFGRDYAGDFGRGKQSLSKRAQIATMKKYYEDKAVEAKRAYQEKKNADYWAGEGAKRKTEIEQERQEQIDIRKKAIDDATNEVQTLFGKNTGYKLNVTLNNYGSYKLGVEVDEKRGWDSIELYVERKLSNDFKTELSLGSVRCDYSDPDDVKQAQNLFYCGNLIMQHANKIKDILIKHGAILEEAGKKLSELNAELNKNY